MMKPISKKKCLFVVLLGLFVAVGGGCHESGDFNAETMREFLGEFAHELAAAFLL